MNNQKIQIIRAIAIIAVVMIHTTPDGMWQVFCKPFINFAVATFIFLSGYLTRIDNENWANFYTRRISRVIVPYVIWTLIYSVLDEPSFNLWQLIKKLISANANSTLYFIFVYIQFVLLTPILARLAKSNYRNLVWLVAPISVIIFKYYVLFENIEPNKNLALLWANLCLGWFTFYYLGLILGNKIIERRYNLHILFILYAAAIILQICEGYLWALSDITGCGSQLKLSSILTSSLFVLIIYTLLENDNYQPSCRTLSFIGDHSFGIYLSHIMILKGLEKIAFYKYIPYPLNALSVLSLSLLFCWVVYRVVGKRTSRWIGVI